MRSAVLIALLAALALAPAAPARTVIRIDAEVQPRLAGSSLVWVQDGVLVRRRPGGQETRTALGPGHAGILGASATHVVVSRAVEDCEPGGGCVTRGEYLAGPLDGPLTRVTAPGCPVLEGTMDLEGDRLVMVENHELCDSPARQFAVVRIDLETGARRTLARVGKAIDQLNIAGDWVAWSRARWAGPPEITVWSAGRVRERITGPAEALATGTWDMQDDGTVALLERHCRGEPAGAVLVFRPGRPVRRLALRLDCYQWTFRLAGDRIVGGGGEGRTVVSDLEGRSRRIRGVRGPAAAPADFDGRRAVWLKVNWTQAGIETVYRRWIISDVIAR